MCFNTTLLIRPRLAFPFYAYRTVLYVCISIPALKTGSSVPFRKCCLYLALVMVLEKTLESPLNSKEIKPVSLKGNQSWIFIGKTDSGAEAPILWPPDERRRLTGQDPDAGRNCGQQQKGATEGEMVGWQIMPSAAIQTDLEFVLLSEVSQTEEKYLTCLIHGV